MPRTSLSVAVFGVLSCVPARAVALPLAAAALFLSSCSPTFIQNQTEERQGNISVQFVNNTQYRASFSFGAWDDLDRTPGAISLQQQRLERFTATAVLTLPCRRNTAIGTQKLVDRVDITETNVADADAFGVLVNFSAAPSTDVGAALPTAGTAEGREFLLGVDYSCVDLLVFTFVEDETAPGGFRIDFTLVPDEEPDA